MTPEAMAALHRRCFRDSPRPWTAGEFAALLAEPSTLTVAAAAGFAVGRVVGPEAELLTLAVAPEARRRGVAATLLRGFEDEAAKRGAETVFLEVASDNAPALALYSGLGYRRVGLRARYYARRPDPAVDALVLARALGGAPGKTD